MTRPRLIETFNTHRMTAAVIQAVKTARDLELEEAMQAVRQAASQPQQTAQHLIVYGERGSGKSFLMRLIEIETEQLARQENLAVVAALLPEEQYNIRSAPQLLQAIAAKVRGAGWEAAAFALDFRPQAEAWDAAVADLNAALDQRFGEGQGLVVAMVENFDSLTRSLFGSGAATQKKTASAKAIEQTAAEQLLRKLMNTQGSRLMLIASATGTVDQDYERPLFQAFKTLDLRIWTSDDCIAYFNRRRALENQPALSPAETARARAIAEFIGGNPRLAQLLGEVLASPDARSVAATLDALSDHLADYYRHRLDDLPPQSAALLDALIRKGEPCTQTELAARVGATSQAQIADAFSYLLSGRLLAAGPDKTAAGRLYRVRDRLFVHFYRRRYGEPEQALGLAPIAELLESFFTQREREEHTRKHLEAGEWADASLYALNTPMLSEFEGGLCIYRDSALTGVPSDLFLLSGLTVAEAVEAQGELKLDPKLAVKRWKDAANHANSILARTAASLVEAIALSRCQMDNEAEVTLKTTLVMAESDRDIDSQILALIQLVGFTLFRRQDDAEAFALATRAELLTGQAHNDYVRAMALCIKAFNLGEKGHYHEAIAILDEADELASSINSPRTKIFAVGFKAFFLDELDSNDEAISVAKQASDLAVATGADYLQILALVVQNQILDKKIDRQKEEFSKKEREYNRMLRLYSRALRQLKKPEDALIKAREAATHAAKLDDLGIQADATLAVSQALNDLRKYDEGATTLEEAAKLASGSEDAALKVALIIEKARIFYALNQHERAVELAQIAFESSPAGDALVQAEALNLKAQALTRLERIDEAVIDFDTASTIAESANLKQLLTEILANKLICLAYRKPEQAMVIAQEALKKERNTSSVAILWIMRRLFFAVAARTKATDVVQVFEACLSEAKTDESLQPLANMLDEILAAVAYNGNWDELAACLLRHPQALPLLRTSSAFYEVGRIWNDLFNLHGRANTYALIAPQLTAIARLIEILPIANTETDGHLRSLINGLVNHCEDAGFLQDLADLLKDGFGEKAEPEIQRLRTFAEVHAAPDKEKVLQRLDPDLALAIRRIVGLPEPDDLLAQKGRRKGR